MKEKNIKSGLHEAQFQSLKIAMQYSFLFWYSIPAQRSLCLTPTAATAFLPLFPFDVSRLGVIGRSMFHASA
jgi:hypothetical protein